MNYLLWPLTQNIINKRTTGRLSDGSTEKDNSGHFIITIFSHSQNQEILQYRKDQIILYENFIFFIITELVFVITGQMTFTYERRGTKVPLNLRRGLHTIPRFLEVGIKQIHTCCIILLCNNAEFTMMQKLLFLDTRIIKWYQKYRTSIR